MKILVLGASGMLGKDITYFFSKQKGYETFAISRNKNNILPYDNIKVINIDITKDIIFTETLKKIKPDIIVHSAAVANVDACEEDQDYAMLLHGGIIKTIAREVPNTMLIYISTDSVFDGISGNYTEEDVPNPLNKYALSKYQGELNALNLMKKHMIIRTNIFGYHLFNQTSLSEWAFDNFRQNNPIIGYSDFFFNPVYTGELATIIFKLIQIEFNGIINIASDAFISKHFFLVELATKFGFNKNLVIEEPFSMINFKALRPYNTTLNTLFLKETIGYVPNLFFGLDMFYKQFKNRSI